MIDLRMFCVCRNHKCPFLLHHVLPGVLTRGTRRVILVEHELPTLPEHPNSPLIFSVVRVAQSLVFCVVLYRPLIVLYLLVIALSVVLWFTTSDYLLIYDFWLPFDLRLLITFWFTTSDYLLIYGFWLPFDLRLLITFWFTASDYLLIYGFWLPFDLRLLITFWLTASDYPYSILKLFFQILIDRLVYLNLPDLVQ